MRRQFAIWIYNTLELPKSRLTRRKRSVILIFKYKKRLLLLFLFGFVLIFLAAASFFAGRFFDTSRQAPLVSKSELTQKVMQLADGAHDEALLRLLGEKGIAVIMAQIVAESGGGSVMDCHQQAHRIGRLGYQALGEHAFQECDASCHSGCYHGAMESFLNKKGTANLAENIAELCDTFSTSFGHFECLHGVGHGVLAYVNYDLPDAILECDKLSDSFAQSSCYGGLFMENILTGQGLGAGERGHETSWLNHEDPYFPCNALEAEANLQRECWTMQTSWMLTMYQYDFQKVAKACLGAPRDMAPFCFLSYGRDAAGHTLRDPQKILDLCAYAPQKEDYHERCIVGALNVIVDFWGPKLAGQAAELCAMVTEKATRGTCYQALAGRIPGLYDDAEHHMKACSLVEEQYRSLCAI